MNSPTSTINTRLTFGQRELRRPSLRDDVEQLEELVLFGSSRVDPKDRTYIDPGFTGINIVPSGPMFHIISQLNGKDLFHFAQVSHRFNRLTERYREFRYAKEDFDTLMAKNGTRSEIWWMARCHPERSCSSKVFDWISANGYTEVVILLLAADKPCSEDALNSASANGHTEIVKLLLAANKPCTTTALEYTSKTGHTEIVKLLLVAPNCSNGAIENYPEGSSPYSVCALNLASAYGHVEVVKLLLAAGSPYSDCSLCVLNLSFFYDHVEVVILLLAANKPCSEGALNLTSRNGYTEIVKLLLAADIGTHLGSNSGYTRDC